MFGKGLITGMKVTLKHFFGKKSTFCYPEEKLPMTERFRGGHLVLDYKKCVACTLCSLACPSGALKLHVVTDANKKRHLDSYVHELGRCLFCNLCIDNCAPNGLHWDKNYDNSSWFKEDMTYEVMTDADRKMLADIMAEAAANPKPPVVPKPAAPATKPAAEATKPAAEAPTAHPAADAKPAAKPAADTVKSAAEAKPVAESTKTEVKAND